MEKIFKTLTNHAQSQMESRAKGQDAPAALRITSKELETVQVNCNELHNKSFELLDSERVEHEIESCQPLTLKMHLTSFAHALARTSRCREEY